MDNVWAEDSDSILAYDSGLPSGRTIADRIAPALDWASSGRYGRNLGTVTDWHGLTVGTVTGRSTYRNALTGSTMTALTVRTAGGRILHGRYGSDWSQAVTLRPSRRNGAA